MGNYVVREPKMISVIAKFRAGTPISEIARAEGYSFRTIKVRLERLGFDVNVGQLTPLKKQSRMNQFRAAAARLKAKKK